MALDVYTQTDILNILRATHVASEGSTTLALEVLGDQALQAAVDGAGAPAEREAYREVLLRMYRRGFYTALSSVALAFGLVPVAHERHGPSGRTPGGEELLGALERPDFLWRDARG